MSSVTSIDDMRAKVATINLKVFGDGDKPTSATLKSFRKAAQLIAMAVRPAGDVQYGYLGYVQDKAAYLLKAGKEFTAPGNPEKP